IVLLSAMDCLLFPYTTLFRSDAFQPVVACKGQMRSSTFAAALAGAIVLLAVVGGAIYLMSPPERQDATPVSGPAQRVVPGGPQRSEEHTSELQSREKLVCRLL